MISVKKLNVLPWLLRESTAKVNAKLVGHAVFAGLLLNK